MSAVKVAIFGAAGRMGHALVRCARARGDIAVVAAVNRAAMPPWGRTRGCGRGGAAGVAVTDRPEAALAADAVIDFSFHDAVPAHAEFCAGRGKPMVIGSTGLDEAERRRLLEAARRIPIVWAPT